MDSALDTIQYQRFFFLLRNHCRYLQLYFYVSCFYFVFADGDDGGGDDDDGGGGAVAAAAADDDDDD